MNDTDHEVIGDSCRQTIGVEGDNSCPELVTHIHCRNCPEFAKIGRALLFRQTPVHYSEQWSQVLAGQSDTAESIQQESVIVFRIAEQRLAMPVTIVKDVRDQVPVRLIPHRSNERLRGLVNIRGELRLCVSLHAFMGLSPDDNSSPTMHMIMIEKDESNWVFGVDELYGLHHFNADEVQNTPVQAAKTVDPITMGVIKQDEEVIGLVDKNAIFKVFEGSLR